MSIRSCCFRLKMCGARRMVDSLHSWVMLCRQCCVVKSVSFGPHPQVHSKTTTASLEKAAVEAQIKGDRCVGGWVGTVQE